MIKLCKGDIVVPVNTLPYWRDWNENMTYFIGIEGVITRINYLSEIPYAHIQHDNGETWYWPIQCLDFSDEGGE